MKIKSQSDIDMAQSQECERYQRRARIALREIQRGQRYGRHIALGDGRYFVRHAAQHSDNPHFMAALVRQTGE